MEEAEEGPLVDSLLGCEKSKTLLSPRRTLQVHLAILLGTFSPHIFLIDAKLESWEIFLPIEQRSRMHFPDHSQIFWIQ